MKNNTHRYLLQSRNENNGNGGNIIWYLCDTKASVTSDDDWILLGNGLLFQAKSASDDWGDEVNEGFNVVIASMGGGAIKSNIWLLAVANINEKMRELSEDIKDELSTKIKNLQLEQESSPTEMRKAEIIGLQNTLLRNFFYCDIEMQLGGRPKSGESISEKNFKPKLKNGIITIKKIYLS